VIREDRELPAEPSRLNTMGVPRRVSVKGMQRVDATVVVTVVQGKVWMSISPPFTWEAIMEPGKVDEVMSVLGAARDEAKKMAAARDGRASHEGKAVIRAITSGM
jgi:hypothetical protein